MQWAPTAVARQHTGRRPSVPSWPEDATAVTWDAHFEPKTGQAAQREGHAGGTEEEFQVCEGFMSFLGGMDRVLVM